MRPAFLLIILASGGMIEETDTGDMKDLYLRVNRANAERLALDGDVVVVHDPQPLAIKAFRDGGMSWVWRCHIDVSSPDPGVWGFLERYVRMYDAYVFHMVDYVQPGLDKSRVFVMPPSIDPLSEKNREMRYEDPRRLQEELDGVLDVARGEYALWTVDVPGLTRVGRPGKGAFPAAKLLPVGLLTPLGLETGGGVLRNAGDLSLAWKELEERLAQARSKERSVLPNGGFEARQTVPKGGRATDGHWRRSADGCTIVAEQPHEGRWCGKIVTPSPGAQMWLDLPAEPKSVYGVSGWMTTCMCSCR